MSSVVVDTASAFLTPFPDSQKLREMTNVCGFKLLDLGVTCHSDGYLMQRSRDKKGRILGDLLEEVKMTLRPEEREGMDQVQRSLVGGGEGKHDGPEHCTPGALHQEECDAMQEDQGPCN